MNKDPITATEEQRSQLSLFGSWTIDLLVLGGTFGLAFLGVAITYVNRDLSYLYWLMMVPVFGTLCFVAHSNVRSS